MLDVSDGLTGDLGHILAASRVGAIVELASIPRSDALGRKLGGDERELALQCLLAGGDDYELLFAAPSTRRVDVEAAGVAGAVAVTRIGRITGDAGLVVRDESGRPLASLPRAFDHFTERS